MGDGVKFNSREEWLMAATLELTPMFVAKGYDVPAIRVACGWPSSKGLSAKARRIGECWAAEAASDGVSQIFISPWLNDVLHAQGVLATHTHEMIHAIVGIKCGHKGPFKQCARAIGLEGKLTSTHAGAELTETLKGISDKLGPYPHAKLDILQRPTKKQTTRMLKCECPQCGFVVRTTKKWLDDVGAPHCPNHGKMAVDEPTTKDDDSDEGGE